MEKLEELPLSWAQKYKDRVAFLDLDHREITYETFYREVCKLMSKLNQKGISKDNRVLLQLKNSALSIECFFALINLGAVPILCSMELGNREFGLAKEKMSPVAYITDKTDVTNQENGMTVILRKELLHAATASSEGGMLGKTEETIAAIIMSGGTTGIPRFIPMDKKKLLLHLRLSSKRCGINETTRLLSVLPLVHKMGFYSPGVLSVLDRGGLVVFNDTKDFFLLSDIVRQYKINFLIVVPSFVKLWLEEIEVNELQVDTIFSGGEHLDVETARQIEGKFCGKLLQLYGMTEGVCFITGEKETQKTRYNTQGKTISDGDQYRIVNDNGTRVTRGQIGELLFRSDYLFDGYLLNKEENEKLFCSDGFFKTGDLVREDEEGNIIAVGRKREQINVAGEKMIPSELENYLLEIPEIIDCAVMGLPDTYTGERICSVLVLRNKLEIKTIRKMIKEKLDSLSISKYKYPSQMVIRDKLPYTRVGKVDKSRLRKEIQINEG